MADVTNWLRIRAKLRQFPHLYGTLRFLRNVCPYLLREFARTFGIGFRFGAARGFFSGLQLVRSGSAEGELIFTGQSLPPLPDHSMIRHCGMNQNARQPWPVFWARFPNARLVGPALAVMDSSKKLMLESVYGEEFCHGACSNNYTILDKPYFLSGSWTSVVGEFPGFYHWLTDAMPRLALLEKFPADTRIIVRTPYGPSQNESLAMLGLLDRVRETTENHLLVEDFCFSSPTSMTGCVNPYAVGWLREQFLKHAATAATPPKFFITRKSKTRGIRNLSEIVDFFLSSGWAVLDMEELTFSEQIAFFRNAEMIVGEHGAAFTNLLWCRPECRIVELFPHNYLNGCYEAISICLGLDHRFHVFEADSGHTFHVPLDVLKRFL